MARLVHLEGLEVLQDLPRPPEDLGREPGELRHLDAVAARCASRDRAFRRNTTRSPTSRTATVRFRDPRPLARELLQLVVVGREQRAAAAGRAGARRPPRRSRAPSKVDVPRPISSRTTSERRVALWRMAAVSVISTMKVERPRARSSDAPTRVKIRSTTPDPRAPRRHEAAHLREERDERRLAHHRALPGHVRAGDDEDRAVPSAPASRARRRVSFGTKPPEPAGSTASTTGWRRPRSRAPRTRPPPAALAALAATRASASERIRVARRLRRGAERPRSADDPWRSSSKIRCSSAARFSSAPSTCSSNSFSAGVTYRSPPAGGLPPLPLLGDVVEVRPRDLEVVPEHPVEPDLQRPDAGLLPLLASSRAMDPFPSSEIATSRSSSSDQPRRMIPPSSSVAGGDSSTARSRSAARSSSPRSPRAASRRSGADVASSSPASRGSAASAPASRRRSRRSLAPARAARGAARRRRPASALRRGPRARPTTQRARPPPRAARRCGRGPRAASAATRRACARRGR